MYKLLFLIEDRVLTLTSRQLCQRCGRRVPLRGNWSCGGCAPGRYDPAFRMTLREELGDPWGRVVARWDRVVECLDEALMPEAGVSPACDVSSLSATRPLPRPASR